MKSRLIAWLELFRVPNLCTVPGDPLMGLAVAASATRFGAGPPGAWSVGTAAAACGVALLLYLAGLVLNDLVDLKQDRAERPQRPLPSGRVPPRQAAAAFILLTAGGLGLAWSVHPHVFMAALMLSLFVGLYNLGFKELRVFGPMTMGLCRGCSILLGAAALDGERWDATALVVLFHLQTLYIALVTLVAEYETRPSALPGIGWLPSGVLAAGLLGMMWIYLPDPFSSAAFGFLAGSLFALVQAFGAGRAIQRGGRVLPPHIGRLISALIGLQAGVLFLSGAPFSGLLIALMWPLNRLLVRRFYAS